MNSNGDKRRAQLDLGLSQILSGVSAEGSPNPSVVVEPPTMGAPSGPSQTPPSQWTLGSNPPEDRSEFDALADERNWTEIVKRVEPRIVDPNDLEARLWWIRGHLGAFSLPVAFLAAPMETVCRWAKSRPLSGSLNGLMRETGVLVLDRLREVGERDLAESVRASLRAVGITEPKGVRGRERRATSSFRSMDFDAERVAPAFHDTTQTSLNAGFGVRHAIAILVLVVIGCLGYVQRERLAAVFLPEALVIADEDFAREPLAFAQVAPLSERRDPGSRLGAVFYSLENGGASGQAGSRPSREVGSVQGLDQPVKDAGHNGAGIIDPNGASGVDSQNPMVNTKGPVEGEEFRNGIERRQSSEPEERRAPLEGGPPAAVLPESDTPGFESERIYRVLGHTDILSAPSFGGRQIGTLEYGDRVLANGRLGRWIRLRSRQGRGGYVLAEDLEELFEGTTAPSDGSSR